MYTYTLNIPTEFWVERSELVYLLHLTIIGAAGEPVHQINVNRSTMGAYKCEVEYVGPRILSTIIAEQKNDSNAGDRILFVGQLMYLKENDALH